MARQNVGKPRFFIDLIQYWDAKGLLAGIGPYASYGYYAGNSNGAADTTGESPNGYYSGWLNDVGPPGSSFGNSKGYQPELIGFTPHSYMERPLYPTGSNENSTAYFAHSIVFKERVKFPETEKYFQCVLNHNFNELDVSHITFGFAQTHNDWLDIYTSPLSGSYNSPGLNYQNHSSTNSRESIINGAVVSGVGTETLLNGWTLNEIRNTDQFLTPVNQLEEEPLNSQWAYGSHLGDPLPSGNTWNFAGAGCDLIYCTIATNRTIADYYDENDGRRNMILGSLNFGPIYEMDTSPDLKLSMTREYDGIKTQQTKSGHTLTDIKYDGPPPWRDNMPAWGLHRNNNRSSWRHLYKKAPSRGRRVWDLQFSYLDDTDVMSLNESLFSINPTDSGDFLDGKITGYDESDFETRDEGYGDEQHFVYDSETAPDFFSVVIEKTMGGTLPFIFQPDGNNDSPDQFAICIMDRKSIKIRQIAHNVYSIKLKIKEVW